MAARGDDTRGASAPHDGMGVDVEAVVAGADVADAHDAPARPGCSWRAVVRLAVASIAVTAVVLLVLVHAAQSNARATGAAGTSTGAGGAWRALSQLLSGPAPGDAHVATGYPRVSVMVVTRNRPTFLAHALRNIDMQDYPNLEVVIIDDSDVPVVGVGASPTPMVNQGAAAATPDVTAAAVAAPLDAAQATRARHAGSSATYRVSRELLALQGKLLGDAATPEQAAAAEASRSAPPGAVRTYRYFHFAAQMSIGEKRNQAAGRASGDIVITWDDDDLFRPHRISRQVEPIVAGHCEITTLAHGVYMYAASQRFFNWTLSGPTERSPHFGTLAYTTRIIRAGVRYPPTSFGEDYGFAERALDAGFRLRTLQNDDGTFVYVRHGKAGPDDSTTRASGNTWQISAELQQALSQNLAAIQPPTWMTPASRAFFDALAAAGGTSQGMEARAAAEVGGTAGNDNRGPGAAVSKAAVNAAAAAADADATGGKKAGHPNGVLKYHLPKDIHGGHTSLNWHLVKQRGNEGGASGVRRRRLARITTALLAKRRRLAINPFCMYADAYAYAYGYELGYGYMYGMYREHITRAYPECYPTVMLDASSSLDSNGIMATTRVSVVANFSSEVENFEARDLQVTGDDVGLRYGPRTLTRLSERAWRVEFDILAISGDRNTATVTMRVPGGVVYPRNAPSNDEAVRFGPPTPRLTSDDAPSTGSNVVVFVATFVDMWNFNPKPVSGMHVGAWNMQVTPPQASVTVLLHEPAGGAWPHAWLMAVRLDPPLRPEGAVITVDVDSREGGLQPYNAAALEPVTVTIVPARAVVTATSGGETVGDVISVSAGDRVLVFNATVGVELTEVPSNSASLWSFDFDKYLSGAVIEELPTVEGDGFTTLQVKVTLPASMRRATVVAQLSGDLTLPAFVSPPPYTVTYECPIATEGVAGCRHRHLVFRQQPTGGSIAVDSNTVPFFNRASTNLNYLWSLDASNSQPGDGFAFPTSSFRITNPTLSLTSTPAGLYALQVSATASQPAGSPMLTSTALLTARVWDIGLDFTPPSFVYAGQTFTVDWHARLPSGASVELVLRGQDGEALFTAVVPHGGDIVTKSLTVSVGADTASQTVRVELNAVPHTGFVGANGDITSQLTDSTQLTVRSPFNARTLPWSDCSQSCGPGVKSREVVCEDTSRTPAAAVPTSYCVNAGITMPTATGTCNEGECPTYWWYKGDWNTCSQPCGSDGTQSRTVECRTGDVKVNDETLCTDAKPATTQSCNTHPCASYLWRATAWGACNLNCGPAGSGTRSRTVFCAERDTLAPAADSACLASQEAGAKLATTEACDPAAATCTAGSFYFATGPASKCSQPCGGGTATRTVTCYSGDGVAQGSHAPCTSAGLVAPSATVSCNTASCYSVRVGEYSDCSQSCGVGGFKTRTVACMYRGTTKVDGSECTAAGIVMPPSDVACNTQPCPNVFCVDNDCNDHGTCSNAEARCVCADNWKGTYCETPPACTTGEVYDITGGCCAGTLNATGHCCAGGTIDETTGACCPVGYTALDNCGRCAQPNAIPNVVLDTHGECCAWDAVDASGQCCDQGLDVCMVCGGQGLCPRRQSLMLVSGTYGTVAGLQGSDAVAALADAVRTRLLLQAGSSAALQVLTTTVNPNVGRRLANTYFDSQVTVTPDPNPAPDNLDANMAGLAGLSTPDLGVESAGPPVPAPVCGNGVCEIGEACVAGSTDCCVFDCPTRRLTCPVSSNQASAAAGTCSGRGRCDTVSGTCKCNTGYAGAACDACAVGYTRPTGNRCVSLAIINSVAGQVADRGQVGNGGGDGGSTSGDGSQATSGDGQTGNDDGVTEVYDQPEGVLLTVEEWFIVIVTIVILVFLVACLCYLCCFSGTDDSGGDGDEEEEEMAKQQAMAAAWYAQYPPPYGYGPPPQPQQLGQPPQGAAGQPTNIFDASKRGVHEREVGHLEHGPSTYSSPAGTPLHNPVVSQTLAHNDPAMRRARLSSASAARLDARSESQHGSVISDAVPAADDDDDGDLVAQMALQADSGGARLAPPPGLLSTPAPNRGAALPPLDDPVARAALMAGGDSDDDGMDMRPPQPVR